MYIYYIIIYTYICVPMCINIYIYVVYLKYTYG